MKCYFCKQTINTNEPYISFKNAIMFYGTKCLINKKSHLDCFLNKTELYKIKKVK